MSNRVRIRKSADGGIGFSGLAGLVAGVYSAVTTPVFVGGTGLGMAALVGVATFVGGSLGAVAGLLVGGIAGAAVCGVIGAVWAHGAKGLKIGLLAVGAVGGAVTGSMAGAGYGAYKGYTLGQRAMEEEACAAPFNDAVARACRHRVPLVAASRGAAPVTPAR